MNCKSAIKAAERMEHFCCYYEEMTENVIFPPGDYAITMKSSFNAITLYQLYNILRVNILQLRSLHFKVIRVFRKCDEEIVEMIPDPDERAHFEEFRALCKNRVVDIQLISYASWLDTWVFKHDKLVDAIGYDELADQSLFHSYVQIRWVISQNIRAMDRILNSCRPRKHALAAD